VHVAAKDLGTGKEQTIKITASSGLSEAEIQKMVKEAEMNKAEDEKRKNLVNTKNTLDGMIYSVEKTMKEQAEKIDASTKDNLGKSLEAAKKALESNDEATMKKATEDLTTASNAMAELLYKNASPQRAQETAGAQSETNANNGGADHSASDAKANKGDDVIDADFKEI
jgi:molecular chaperone DnaK